MVIRHAKYAQKSSWSRCLQHMARLTSRFTEMLASRWAYMLLSCRYLHLTAWLTQKPAACSMLLPCSFAVSTHTLHCSVLLLKMHATFMCSCVELLATDQTTKPAMQKATTCCLNSDIIIRCQQYLGPFLLLHITPSIQTGF